MIPSLGINSWEKVTLSSLAEEILTISSKPLILIDGNGGSGKTTFAKRLVSILDANLVSSDDICWYADPIYWDGEMIDGIIRPWLKGEGIAYRPSGWIKENRSGSINVDPDKALVIEGMGACRKTLFEFAAFSVWVDSEPDVARMRVINRDLAAGENGGTLESVSQFTDWWDSLLHPFFLQEEPWNHANIIVNGSLYDEESDMIYYVKNYIFNGKEF